MTASPAGSAGGTRSAGGGTGTHEAAGSPRRLARAIDQLVNQVAHWTPARWAAGGAGDRVHALAQRLADLGADAEHRGHRPLPRLDSDLALPDQVRVLAADLLAADPPAEVLAAAVDAVRHARAGI